MFEVTARLRIREGELEGFKQQAAEIMRQVREKDTKTLRYDWFLSDDGTRCEVREGYVDADALLEHARNIGEARAQLFHDFAYDHDMTLYGEPSPPADQHVVERFTRTGPDTLLYRFTVESGDHEAPYTGEFTWPATSGRLYEYACHEGNYSMGNTLRGARFLEREATAGASR